MILGKSREIASLILGREVDDKELRALVGNTDFEDYTNIRTKIILSREFKERYPEVYHFVVSRVEERVNRSHLAHEIVKLKQEIDELRNQRAAIDERLTNFLREFDELLTDVKRLDSRVVELNSVAAAITTSLGG